MIMLAGTPRLPSSLLSRGDAAAEGGTLLSSIRTTTSCCSVPLLVALASGKSSLLAFRLGGNSRRVYTRGPAAASTCLITVRLEVVAVAVAVAGVVAVRCLFGGPVLYKYICMVYKYICMVWLDLVSDRIWKV